MDIYRQQTFKSYKIQKKTKQQKPPKYQQLLTTYLNEPANVFIILIELWD